MIRLLRIHISCPNSSIPVTFSFSFQFFFYLFFCRPHFAAFDFVRRRIRALSSVDCSVWLWHFSGGMFDWWFLNYGQYKQQLLFCNFKTNFQSSIFWLFQYRVVERNTSPPLLLSMYWYDSKCQQSHYRLGSMCRGAGRMKLNACHVKWTPWQHLWGIVGKWRSGSPWSGRKYMWGGEFCGEASISGKD